MKAVIIAHERETTLEPFTSTRPRPMIPILNVPVLGHVIGQLAAVGIKDVTVFVGHLKEKVREYLGNGSAFGIKADYTEVSDDAEFPFKLCELLNEADTPLLLVDGGTYMEKGLIRSVAEYADPEINRLGLGINYNPLYHLQAILSDNKSIIEFKSITIGKIKIAQQSPLPEMNAGVMLVAGRSLTRLSEIVRTEHPVSLENLIVACGKAKFPLTAINTENRFVQLHYPWEILAASYLGLNMEFEGESVRQIHRSASVHRDAILKHTVIIGANTVIESGAMLDNVKIDINCHIHEHAYVMKSLLAPGCRVGPLGFVKGSVMGPKTTVGTPGEFPVAICFGNAGFGHHCHAGMGVFGEGSGLSAGAIVTANRDSPTKVKINGKLMDSGWFNIGAFVGDNTRINAQATIMPGKKLGPNSIIGPGIIVYSDVEPNTMIVLKQDIEKHPIPD